jgi:hypothetical protein
VALRFDLTYHAASCRLRREIATSFVLNQYAASAKGVNNFFVDDE